jgi:hypothetical protein
MCITQHVSSVKRSSSGVPHRTYSLQFLCLCLSAVLYCEKFSSIKRSSSGVPHRTYRLQFLCLCLSAALSCEKLSSVKRSSSEVPHRTYSLQFLCLGPSAALSCKKLAFSGTSVYIDRLVECIHATNRSRQTYVPLKASFVQDSAADRHKHRNWRLYVR